MAEENCDKLIVDPEKFAYATLHSLKFDSTEDLEKVAKRNLTLYLSSYYLARKLNSYELDIVENSKSDAYSELMKLIQNTNRFD